MPAGSRSRLGVCIHGNVRGRPSSPLTFWSHFLCALLCVLVPSVSASNGTGTSGVDGILTRHSACEPSPFCDATGTTALPHARSSSHRPILPSPSGSSAETRARSRNSTPCHKGRIACHRCTLSDRSHRNTAIPVVHRLQTQFSQTIPRVVFGPPDFVSVVHSCAATNYAHTHES